MMDYPCLNRNLSEGQTSNKERDPKQAEIFILSADTIPSKERRLDFPKWSRPSLHLTVRSFLTSTYYQATEIRAKRSWHKDRHRDQQGRTDSPEVHPHGHGRFLFNKGAKTVQWGNGGGNTGCLYAEERSGLLSHPKPHPK